MTGSPFIESIGRPTVRRWPTSRYFRRLLDLDPRRHGRRRRRQRAG